MAVVAGLQGAQVAAAAFLVVLVGEAARVVVEVAAVTAAVVGAATAVAATDQRLLTDSKNFICKRARFPGGLLYFSCVRLAATPSSISGYIV